MSRQSRPTRPVPRPRQDPFVRSPRELGRPTHDPFPRGGRRRFDPVARRRG